jgi:hypothetical protein
MSRDVGDDPMSAILQPSACILQPDPTRGGDVLLQIKGRSTIRQPYDRLVEALFGLLLPLIWLIAKC